MTFRSHNKNKIENIFRFHPFFVFHLNEFKFVFHPISTESFDSNKTKKKSLFANRAK